MDQEDKKYAGSQEGNRKGGHDHGEHKHHGHDGHDHEEHDHYGHGHDREIHIIVNGRRKLWKENHITFEQVVSLAYDGNPPQGENIIFTVAYRRAHGDSEGTLVPGESVKVKEGMIFDVAYTDKS